MTDQNKNQDSEKNQQNIDQNNEKNYTKTIVTVLVALLAVLILLGGGYYLWTEAERENTDSKQQIEKLQEQVNNLKNIVDDKNDDVDEENQDLDIVDEKNWTTFKNDVYKYQIKHPKDAMIKEAKKSDFALSNEERDQGLDFDDVYEKYTGKICVTIEYKYGYVNISVAENKDFAHVICGRTGRTNESTKKSENLTIEDKKYTAEGYVEKGKGDTLESHNETLVIELDSGIRIEYGAIATDQGTYEDYLEIRDVILKIVESFETINK